MSVAPSNARTAARLRDHPGRLVAQRPPRHRRAAGGRGRSGALAGLRRRRAVQQPAAQAGLEVALLGPSLQWRSARRCSWRPAGDFKPRWRRAGGEFDRRDAWRSSDLAAGRRTARSVRVAARHRLPGAGWRHRRAGALAAAPPRACRAGGIDTVRRGRATRCGAAALASSGGAALCIACRRAAARAARAAGRAFRRRRLGAGRQRLSRVTRDAGPHGPAAGRCVVAPTRPARRAGHRLEAVVPGRCRCLAPASRSCWASMRQTIGGYAKIATVIRADLPRLAHLRLRRRCASRACRAPRRWPQGRLAADAARLAARIGRRVAAANGRSGAACRTPDQRHDRCPPSSPGTDVASDKRINLNADLGEILRCLDDGPR